jgi:hypothetical protein
MSGQRNRFLRQLTRFSAQATRASQARKKAVLSQLDVW